MDVAVFTCHHLGQLGTVGGHAQALAHGFEQAHAALLMANVARQHVGGRGALAQVVAQAGKAHRQRGAQLGGAVQHQHHVHAGVHLGVVFGALGHAPQAVQLGEQPRQRAAAAQHRKHAGRLGFHQALGQLLPHALGHQVVHFSLGHHGLHEGSGLRSHREIGKAGGKTRQAQDAHRVFAEGRSHMAQHTLGDVGPATVGVNYGIWIKLGCRSRGICASSYRINSEVAPGEVFL